MREDQVPKGGQPKLHHVVARFYLERFAVDGQVELVERENFEKSFPCSISKALAENYFYSVETEEGREPLGEKLLADHVDGPSSEAMRRVFDQGRPLAAPGPRQQISLFLAFQFVRGRRVRHSLVEQTKAAALKLVSMATPEEVRRVAQK